MLSFNQNKSIIQSIQTRSIDYTVNWKRRIEHLDCNMQQLVIGETKIEINRDIKEHRKLGGGGGVCE